MARLVQSFDWTNTPLGSVETWPQSLRSALSICLGSRFPIVIYWGSDFTVFYNDAYAEILGKKHPWALGRACKEVWAEIWDVIGPMLDRVLVLGEATWSSDQLLLLERRGYAEECYFSFSFSPVRGEGGGVDGIFTAVIENTGRVLAERRLRTLRDMGTALVNAKSAEDACQISACTLEDNPADVPFALLYLVNPQTKRGSLIASAGNGNAVAIAPVSFELDGPEHAGGWPLATVCRTGERALVENTPSAALVLPLSTAGDSLCAGVLVAGVSPRLELDQEYAGFFDVVARRIAGAISETRAYEAERRRAEALAELDRAKTAFFSNVSHEFRTPLTLILGPLEELKQQSGCHELSVSQYQQIDLVYRNSLRLLKLTNTLLDFARIEAGRAQAVYEATDLSTYTAELASVFRSAIEKAGLRLVVDCPPLIDDAFADREMWEKIVLNLLSNALKFTFEGEIEVKLRKTPLHFELDVRDTGTGIPADELPKLFERFHRVANAQGRTHEGSGIGLALVQELARLHGGSVSVESVFGKGSTFRVSIPVGREHLPQQQVGAARTQSSTPVGARPFIEEALRWLPGSDASAALDIETITPAALSERGGEERPRVLLADDNADMRDYVRNLLSSRYDVEAVPDGEAALAAIDHRLPDLVLADVMMPRLDGLGLLARLRANPRAQNLPIILVSARAGEEAKVEGLTAGADDYLIKPFSAREMLARVAATISIARLRRESEQALRANESRLRSRNTQLSLLSDALQHLLSSKDPERIVRDLFPKVAAHLGVDTYFNYMVDEGCQLKLHSCAGVSEETAREIACLEFGQAICGTVAQTRSPIVATDILNSSYDKAALVRELGIQVYACNPLISSDNLLGTLSFASRTRTHFEEDELEFMRIVSRYVALAMDRAAAEQTLQRNQAWLAGQKAAFQAAMDGASLATSLGILIQTAIEQAECERRCAFYLADANGKTLRHLVGMPGSYARCVDGFEISPQSLACGLAVSSGQPVITPDVVQEPRWKPWLWLARDYDYRGCWSFPVETSSGKIVGSFSMYFKEPREATPRDRQLAAALTHAASIIISRYQEAEERQRTDERLRQSERQFREALESLPAAVYTTDARGRITMFNQAAVQFSGRVPELGTDKWCVSWKLYQPDGTPLPHDECPMARALKEGRSIRGEEAIAERPDGTRIHFVPYPTPLRNGNGELVGAINMLVDITDRKRAEETQRLLINELQHRVKNTLASVQAIMQHTLRSTSSPEQFATSFTGRIQSLSRVHSLLSNTQWQGADMRDVIRDQLCSGPADETRVIAWGPGIQLAPQIALHLALIVHELGTNSAKYGALSSPEGHVSISWKLADDQLQLHWTERGGPPVKAPSRRGFGMTLIEQSAQAEGGSANMIVEADGIAWDIALPVPNPPMPNAAVAARDSHDRVSLQTRNQTGRLAGKRLLVVEDEPIVGLDIVATLKDRGAEVHGPVGNAKDALRVVESATFDGALLDANLHGKPVDEIAAALTRRQLPFAFVTGYGRASLPRTFGSAPILPKPFTHDQLIEVASALLSPPAGARRLRE